MSSRDEQHEHWQAIDRSRNIARDYRLSVSTDLFGWTIVERHWGRIGTKGQGRRNAFAHAAEAERLVLFVRRRRESAEQRIGVAYERAGQGAEADGDVDPGCR